MDRIEALLEERFGVACADWQRERLSGAIERIRRRRTAAHRAEPVAPSGDELLALLSEVIVHETYFFRDPKQIDAFVEAALPERAGAGAPGRRIRVVSVGCAQGEEPYSLALAATFRAPELLDRIELHGIDISENAIACARRAAYSRWALRAVPEGLCERCFRDAGSEVVLRPEHAARVTFARQNLFDEDPALWGQASLDVIFCRNVTIYFSDRAIRQAIDRFEAALAPGGFLFLGHAETLRGVSDAFEPVFSHGAVYYRRRAADRRAPAPAAGTAWMDAIRQATERVTEIVDHTPERSEGSVASCPRQDKTDALDSVRRLLAAERFEEGLAVIRRLPDEARRREGVLLLEALLHSGLGRVVEVERVCGELIESGDGIAGAHYLLGLCREHAGERAPAASHYRDAIRIDPGFAMAYVRAGVLARWAGDSEGARSWLQQAIERLTRTPDEHVRLFGGGFSRQALEALCRGDLGALGEGR